MLLLKAIFFLFLSLIYSLAQAETKCKTPGVLIIAHGSHQHGSRHESTEDDHRHNIITMTNDWNEAVMAAFIIAKGKIIFPVELVFGMWEHEAFQQGINKLVSQNICALKVIPLFISSDSEVIDIQKYMFGIRESFDLPIAVNRLKIPSQIESITFQKALDNDELVSEILFERLTEISIDPENEGLLFLAHGPFNDYYELSWLELLKLHGQRVWNIFNVIKNRKFHEINFFVLRDDSSSEIRNERTRLIREKVLELNAKNITPIIVPVLLSSGGIELGIAIRLEGLSYKILNQFLLPHSKIIEWLVFRANN